MKKIYCFWGVLLVSLITMGSCATKLKPYDASIPVNQRCTLILSGIIRVTEFDGTRVQWDAGVGKYGDERTQAMIQIPAGSHRFLVTISKWTEASVHAVADNVRIGYQDFEAGHTYKIDAQFFYTTVQVSIEEVSADT